MTPFDEYAIARGSVHLADPGCGVLCGFDEYCAVTTIVRRVDCPWCQQIIADAKALRGTMPGNAEVEVSVGDRPLVPVDASSLRCDVQCRSFGEHVARRNLDALHVCSFSNGD